MPGGLNNAVTVPEELAKEISSAELFAEKLSPVSWAQRLGYVLELVGHEKLANTLADFVEKNALSYTPLYRAEPVTMAERNAKWKLLSNIQVEPDR